MLFQAKIQINLPNEGVGRFFKRFSSCKLSNSIAIKSIALYADFMPANSRFGLKNGL
jgi:hypothetical protein